MKFFPQLTSLTIPTLACSLALGLTFPIQAADNILYLNSTRGGGTGGRGNYRSAIADALDNYQDGSIFDVDFVQTHVAGDLASWLNSQPIDYYEQIWFDTTRLNTSILNAEDLAALNIWAATNSPEFILDSSFFFRNHTTTSLTDSAAAVTINEVLALQQVGGGLFLGTDGSPFADTANQVLTNFGFDSLFTGNYRITADGEFVGDLLLEPESVGADFFTNHLQGLSTTNVPVGTHILNDNGGNRTIEIYENLFSLSPSRLSHIGASFYTGDRTTPIDDPAASVPEPTATLGTFLSLLFGLVSWRKKSVLSVFRERTPD